jgi:hypothetical protein
VNFSLPPYGAQFLVFSQRKLPAMAAAATTAPSSMDLSKDWEVTFKNASAEADPAPRHLAGLGDWTTDPSLKYFSGVATYEKAVTVSADLLRAKSGLKLFLDFGAGAPATVPGSTSSNSVRANFQPPIGDAAVVWVNGQRAGAVWCPPYRVDVTGLLKAGTNQIRIQVANRAVNYMADKQNHPLPDYTALIAAYPPKRFDAQDMEVIQVMPSGLLGTVQLTSAAGSN